MAAPGHALRGAKPQNWALHATASNELQSSSYLSDIIAFEVRHVHRERCIVPELLLFSARSRVTIALIRYDFMMSFPSCRARVHRARARMAPQSLPSSSHPHSSHKASVRRGRPRLAPMAPMMLSSQQCAHVGNIYCTANIDLEVIHQCCKVPDLVVYLFIVCQFLLPVLQTAALEAAKKALENTRSRAPSRPDPSRTFTYTATK